jgi:predicted dehydrogenase
VLQVGLGARGRTWAKLVRECALVEAVGYVEPRPDARAWAAANGYEAPTFEGLDAALADVDADLALIVTPPEGRLNLVRALAARGIEILAEKPLALALDEGAALVRAAESAGVRLGVAQNFRYLPSTEMLRRRLQSGAFGPPTFATVTYIRNRDGMEPRLNKYPLTMAQPMLLEQSIHHLDLFRFVYDAEVETVSCITWNPAGSMYRDDACMAALLRLTNGVMITYEGTWVSGHEALAFQWRTDCERGVIVQRSLFGDLAEAATRDGEMTPLPIASTDPLVTDAGVLLEDFIRTGRDAGPFGSDGRDHLKTLALTLACVESSRTGRRIDPREYAARAGLEDLL